MVFLAIRTLAADSAPNIVLVMADDQGWGEMGYQGHAHVLTPEFDALAREGIRFNQFYAAAPVCSPTRGSVLTGRNPNRFGCFTWGHMLPPEENTLAETLKVAGYRTGHFGKWHLGSVQRGHETSPGANGFDEWISSPNYFDYDAILSANGTAMPYKGESSDITANLAIEFIRSCAREERRFLAVVWFASPHDPHEARGRDREMYRNLPDAQQHFYGEITAMDRAFGRLRRELRNLGLTDSTLLFYCSDNGAQAKIGSAGNARGFKGEIYEGGLLVPALLEWPGRWPQPRVIDIPTCTIDILPTLLEIAHVRSEPRARLDGISLVPFLDGIATRRRSPIGFWSTGAPGLLTPADVWMKKLLDAQIRGIAPPDVAGISQRAAELRAQVLTQGFRGHSAWLDWPWKLHRIEPPPPNPIRWELYRLDRDPRETEDLVSAQPERTRSMAGQLECWLGGVIASLEGADYPPKLSGRQ